MSTPPPAPARLANPAWFTPVCVTALLLLHAWLSLSATVHESTTVDELPHLTAGHALWATGDYRLQPENGVLPQFWEGLPAWLGGRHLPPPTDPGWTQPNVWTLGHTYFYRAGNDLASLLYAGRAMNLLWSVGTGLLVFGWTRTLFGRAGPWVALTFFAFCPTFLAHGALATSDMCMTFFMLASVGAYWRHVRSPSVGNALLSAFVFGLAFVAKYSAVLLLPMLGALALLRLADRYPMAWRGRLVASRLGRASLLVGSGLLHLAAAWGLIWAFHRFRFEPTTDPALVHDYTRTWAQVLSTVGQPFAGALAWARSIHLLPDAYLYGFGFVVDLSHERGAFLQGATSLTGWVQFFPYAFLVKTPVALLLAILVAIAIAIGRWRQSGARQIAGDAYRGAPLLTLFLVYWAFSLGSSLNIGQRHLLPIYPVVFIAAGLLGWSWRQRTRWSGVILGVLLAGQVAASTSIRPHYLAFFNSIAGGPSQGYRHLVDSSLDWGQDLPGLADWLRVNTNDRTRVYLAYFGTGDPEYYGITATPMVPLLHQPDLDPWYALQPGVYCISATMLSQAYSPIRGTWSAALEREFENLRGIEPALLGYAAAGGEQRAQLEQPVSAAEWTRMWRRYEQLRFTRLCYFLRARKPDAQIGYSINVYQVSAADLQRAVRGTVREWMQAIAPATASPGP